MPLPVTQDCSQLLAAIPKPTNNNVWLNASSSLIGSTIGAAAAIIGSWLTFRRMHHHERNSIRSALRGEIAALLSIAEKRKYRETLHAIANAPINLQALAIMEGIDFTWKQEFFLIYKNNAGKIGLLSKHTKEVAEFYTLCFGLSEDLNALSRMMVSAPSMDPQGHWTQVFKALAKSASTLLKEIEEKGAKLGKDLE